MGVESFLLSSSIVGLIAQRLVRRLCSACKAPYTLHDDERALMGLDSDVDCSHVSEALGCESCHYTGYRGRTGIYELIPIDDTLRSMIHRNESISTLEVHLRPDVPTIREDGFMRVLEGDTSLAEVLRVTSA
jgi:general secretion pathway protein E